jgi:hypothetical protein
LSGGQLVYRYDGVIGLAILEDDLKRPIHIAKTLREPIDKLSFVFSGK